MIDSRDKKFMPHKRDMIFICKKGVQSEQSSAAEEAIEEVVDREKVTTEVGGIEGEVGPSQIKRS